MQRKRGSAPRPGGCAVGTLLLLLLLAFTVTCAPAASDGAAAQAQAQVRAVPFSLSKLFTFLLLTLGPLKVLGPFSAMTRGRDTAFKRRLAVVGTGYAIVALVAAATVGVSTLQKWGVSPGALLLAASLLLFLVSLLEVLRQYAPRRPPPAAPEPAAAALPSVSDLALSLSFPTIATPYGLALVIVILTIRPDQVLPILGLTAVVVALNLLAMFAADRILRTPFVATGLAIVGVVMSVLVMALGIEAGLDALRIMGVL